MSAVRASSAGPRDQRQTIVIAVFAALLIAFGIYAYTSFAGDSTPAKVAPPVVINKPTAAAGVNTTSSSSGATTTTRSQTALGLGVAAGVEARKMASTSSSLDPTLDEAAMLRTESLVYSGTGRNIFSATYTAPVAVVKNVPPPRPTAPVDPGPVVPPPPPPPPPINLKFFGTEVRSSGVRQAFLLQGEDVYLASPGDIVARKYKIKSITATSIQVEDLSNSNTQTLPLQAN